MEAGFTPVEAIQIGTENGALYLGQQDRIGTLAAGKQADLILIKGNPSRRIDEIENVETVSKAGIGYDSQKLIDSVRGQVGIRWWHSGCSDCHQHDSGRVVGQQEVDKSRSCVHT